MNKKIVFLDVDLTLITRKEELVASAVEACREARKNGHKLFICTGRPRILVYDYIVNIGFDGMISSAGAKIRVGERDILDKSMPVELVKRVIDFALENKFPLLVEKNDYFSITPDLSKWFDETIYAERDKLTDPSLFVDTIMRHCDYNYLSFADTKKILFFDKDGNKPEKKQELIDKFGEDYNIIYQPIASSEKASIEINGKSTTKGAAIEYLLNYLQVSADDTIAFGDGDNDLEMFEICNKAVAMGNAKETLKSKADFVTADVTEDGLYKGFKEMGLI
ncbi:MAG: HAD family hydrolase [Elusimicrobiota bacterium]|jgi:Cof subfamily protein (haloacid dehalogenase superfamily)|nr:HAD family hydrolase [Elusimicrobiota bacterium]